MANVGFIVARVKLIFFKPNRKKLFIKTNLLKQNSI